MTDLTALTILEDSRAIVADKRRWKQLGATEAFNMGFDLNPRYKAIELFNMMAMSEQISAALKALCKAAGIPSTASLRRIAGTGRKHKDVVTVWDKAIEALKDGTKT